MSDLSGQEREAPKRAYQCPGCFSISTLPLLAGGYECDCGEALSLIDLRAALAAREDTERPEERPEWLIKVLQQARADLAKAASWIIDVERHERIQTAVQRVADAMRDNELLTERVVHPLIFALEREIERQDEKHGRYEGTMLGRSRLALGTLEDEVAEALKAWRDERAATHWEATRAEVLQVAAVAIRTLRDAL